MGTMVRAFIDTIYSHIKKNLLMVLYIAMERIRIHNSMSTFYSVEPRKWILTHKEKEREKDIFTLHTKQATKP